jgi:hypothetical protein
LLLDDLAYVEMCERVVGILRSRGEQVGMKGFACAGCAWGQGVSRQCQSIA